MTNEELLRMIKKAEASRATRLDLSTKGIATVPPELFQLTKLEMLNLSWNQLTALPLKRGQLASLTELDLSSNKLTGLPPEICQLTNLTKLDLSRNQINSIPPKFSLLTNLTWLDLSENQLTDLPPEICHLTKLERLNLNGNPITSPPPEIAEKGIEAIRNYFAALDKSMQRLNEVKIILVGEGEAGKTSLVKQLLGQPFDKGEDTTHGINIWPWLAEVGGQEIKVNIWDFGGQVIQHAMHQFFLSKRSLYVLVLDSRRDDKTEYWLQHIKAFGGDSPVLIVLNKMDNNPIFDVNRLFLREKYPDIQGFFPTSCSTGDGIADFRKAMLTELDNMKIIGSTWHRAWFDVKRNVEQMNKPYISAKEYEGYCKDVGITDPEHRETLLEYLHDLGVAVHFKGFVLDTMHVLSPEWVTQAVYAIITAKKMVDSKGILYLTALKEIFKEQPIPLPERVRSWFDRPLKKKYDYPESTHAYIKYLMQKFELCYPVGMEAVLIPQLLPVPEPEFAFDYDGSLRFALHYPDFLPPSVFPRFMVKVHRDIEDNLRWRTGVMLTDTMSSAQAVVKADVEARRINIWVQGEHRREYLHYLRYSLADINGSFEKLAVSERVPMPDDPARTADYETLLNIAEAGSDLYMAEGSKKQYSVKELLGLVQPKDTDELARVTEKMHLKPIEKESFTDWLNELVEPRITVLGITFNLKGFFEKLRAWDQQRQQQSRN